MIFRKYFRMEKITDVFIRNVPPVDPKKQGLPYGRSYGRPRAARQWMPPALKNKMYGPGLKRRFEHGPELQML